MKCVCYRNRNNAQLLAGAAGRRPSLSRAPRRSCKSYRTGRCLRVRVRAATLLRPDRNLAFPEKELFPSPSGEKWPAGRTRVRRRPRLPDNTGFAGPSAWRSGIRARTCGSQTARSPAGRGPKPRQSRVVADRIPPRALCLSKATGSTATSPLHPQQRIPPRRQCRRHAGQHAKSVGQRIPGVGHARSRQRALGEFDADPHRHQTDPRP